MNRSAKSLAVACAGSLALLGAVTAANADYPGYGGGAPGPADIWASQHSGYGAVTHEHQHSAAVNGGCAYLHHKAMQTGSSYWWHRFEKCENS